METENINVNKDDNLTALEQQVQSDVEQHLGLLKQCLIH